MFHGSISKHSSKHTEIDGKVRNKIVAESENESQHDSPRNNTLSLVTNSISTTMSNEKFLALRERNPVEALGLLMKLNIFPSKISTKPLTGTAKKCSESSRASFLSQLRTQVLEVDLF